jgi:hypothetical protein
MIGRGRSAQRTTDRRCMISRMDEPSQMGLQVPALLVGDPRITARTTRRPRNSNRGGPSHTGSHTVIERPAKWLRRYIRL